MEPLRPTPIPTHLHTTYTPSHSRSRSEPPNPSDLADSTSLLSIDNDLEKSGYASDSYTDTRTGRPLEPTGYSRALSPSPAPPVTRGREKTHAPSWPHVILTCLALIASAMVLAANAHLLWTYHTYPNAGRMMHTDSGAVMGYWRAWPAELDVSPTWAFVIIGAVGTGVCLLLALGLVIPKFRHMTSRFLATVVVVLNLGLTGSWIALSIVDNFKRQSMETSLPEWSCWHTNSTHFGLKEFSFNTLCTEANVAKYTALVAAGLNLAIAVVVVLGVWYGRRKGYGRIETPGFATARRGLFRRK